MSVVINGGGIIGLFLAGVLSKLTRGNLEIFIVEQNFSQFFDTSIINKVPNIIALSLGAYSELMKINLDTILPIYSTIINKIEISECTRFSEILIHSKDYQLPGLGYVVDISVIKQKLFHILSNQSMIHIFCPATIKKIYRKKSHNIIILSNGKKISSRLIIAADGSSSRLATYCGIKWSRCNYQQTAVVTKIVTEIPHFGTAFEIFTENGPLALLPMSNNLSCVIWCIASKKCKIVSKWNNIQFILELQKIFGWKLGQILNVQPRFFYDLWLIYAKNHVVHRIALVGNAAQTLHPVAGQGFNLGMRDAIILAKIIYRSLFNDNDIGDYSMLELYQKNRRLDQAKVITVTDGLINIFSNHCIPLVICRSLSLLCISNSFFLKKILLDMILSWDVD